MGQYNLVEINGQLVKVNRLFKELPRMWSCPGCLRSVSDIARTSKKGELLAMLVEHHDHIKDFPNAYMRMHWGSDWNKKTPLGFGEFMNKIESFVEGFRTTTICEDCNNAESEAKKLTHAEEHFSFAPTEIRAFIDIGVGRAHKIRLAQARSTYSKLHDDFLLRIDAAEKFVTHALEGRFWACRR